MYLSQLQNSGVKNELISEDYFVKFFCACFYIMLSGIPAVPSLIMSVIGVKKQKSIYGVLGLIFSLITIVFCLWSTLFILS